VLDLVLESLVVLWGGLSHDGGIGIVQLGVSRVHSEHVLPVRVREVGSEVLVQLEAHLLPVEGFLDLLVDLSRLEVADWLGGESLLAPLKDVGSGGLLLDGVELSLQSLVGHHSLV